MLQLATGPRQYSLDSSPSPRGGTRERGEALPLRILGEYHYATARSKLAYQCGVMLGRIHQIPIAELPAGLPDLSPQEDFDRLQALLDQYGNTSAVHQLALNWLRQNTPTHSNLTLVHGDFRNGNLLVDDEGLVAELDWELARIGNPAQDPGYICANVSLKDRMRFSCARLRGICLGLFLKGVNSAHDNHPPDASLWLYC
ncbi:MAG: phosphotransferase [Proteobacteria bacterium]|nr:phosphotransferase [Pseudomonadota bacterium]